MKEQTDFLISATGFEPAYLALHRRGELARRAEAALHHLESCDICPRTCGDNRFEEIGTVCKTGRHARVVSYFPHMGEEDPLRGWEGSGTIFFGRCSLRCVFCQNYDISQMDTGREVTPQRLAQMMLELQRQNCHNINFVTPSHVVPQILEALVLAAEQGLRLPLVYNTGAYDTLHTLRLLDGIVDIYMPDFKFWDRDLARRYLAAPDYPEVARRAFREMQRQVGVLRLDEDGIARRGLLVRHLVMPGCQQDSARIMHFLAGEISPDTYVNIMAQYRPEGKVTAGKYPEINRGPTSAELQSVYVAARTAGLWRFDRRRPLRLF